MPQVQLALVTASVKFFIQRPNQGQQLVQKVLKWATEDIDNPDLRDRGYMYWRLLATNAGAAKGIVMGDRPPVNTDTDRMELGALDQLLLHTGTLGSIYHKTPETFIRHAKGKALAESPALNAASRRVLSKFAGNPSSSFDELNIPLVHLPGSIPQKPVSTARLIPPPGPGREVDLLGPSQPEVASPVTVAPEQGPALPPRPPAAPAHQEPQRQGTANSESELEAIAGVGAPKEYDPYAMLDNAFGYVADQPKPIQGSNQRSEFGDLGL